MAFEQEYYQWYILDNSTIRRTNLPLSTLNVLDYQGMPEPEQIEDTKYKVRITLRYHWKFTNGWLKIESITHAMVDAYTKQSLFLREANEESIKALNFLMVEIEKEIKSYVNSSCPELVNRYKESNEAELYEQSRLLLSSRFELEN